MSLLLRGGTYGGVVRADDNRFGGRFGLDTDDDVVRADDNRFRGWHTVPFS